MDTVGKINFENKNVLISKTKDSISREALLTLITSCELLSKKIQVLSGEILVQSKRISDLELNLKRLNENPRA